MKIEALKFLAQPPGAHPRRSYLDMDGAEEFARNVRTDVPAAHVVRLQDLVPIRKFFEVVVDCGEKKESNRKGLKRYLLGKDRIPLIKGTYKDPGQLKRSVRTLLWNATQTGERNAYLIGTGDALFREVWEQAGRAQQGKMTAERGKRGPGSSGGPDEPEGGSTVSRYLLKFLGGDE